MAVDRRGRGDRLQLLTICDDPRPKEAPGWRGVQEDEWFYVTEGEPAFWVGGQAIKAPAGSFVYGPRDVPHTFEVTSPEARFLLVTDPRGDGRALLSSTSWLVLIPVTSAAASHSTT